MSTAARQEPRRLELVASEIANLPGVETHAYRAGEVLLPTERVKRTHICVRDGALAMRLAVGRANHAILDVFGPGALLTPPVWRTDSDTETRHAAALLPTTTLELPTEAFDRHVRAHPPLALAIVACDADRHAALLDRLAMLSLRDPLRRVAHTLLLLAGRIAAAGDSAASARLEVSQDLIAAFANLSRQTTNRQLRRLARAGLAGLERRVVDLPDLAALCGVAAGRRPAPR
jgi:CRP/FNR family transcriptional regulator, cyclic AMP receptor protein